MTGSVTFFSIVDNPGYWAEIYNSKLESSATEHKTTGIQFIEYNDSSSRTFNGQSLFKDVVYIISEEDLTVSAKVDKVESVDFLSRPSSLSD